MDFSRSHWRVFAAAINASASLASTTPTSCPTFAIFKSVRPALSTAIALRWPKASRTKSIAAPSIDSSLAPSSERMTATASNSTEGVPASCPSTASIAPLASLAPPTLGATIFTVAPASVAAFLIFWMTAPSERVFHLADDLQSGRKRQLLHGRCGRWRIGNFFEAETCGNPAGKVCFDMSQVTDHRLAHVLMFDLGKLKHQRRGDVRLLIGGLTAIELPRLAVVVGEALGTDAAFVSSFSCCGAMKTIGWRFTWRVFRQGVGFIRNTAGRLGHLHVSVALLIVKWALGRVDRNLVKIVRTQAR